MTRYLFSITVFFLLSSGSMKAMVCKEELENAGNLGLVPEQAFQQIVKYCKGHDLLALQLTCRYIKRSVEMLERINAGYFSLLNPNVFGVLTNHLDSQGVNALRSTCQKLNKNLESEFKKNATQTLIVQKRRFFSELQNDLYNDVYEYWQNILMPIVMSTVMSEIVVCGAVMFVIPKKWMKIDCGPQSFPTFIRLLFSLTPRAILCNVTVNFLYWAFVTKNFYQKFMRWAHQADINSCELQQIYSLFNFRLARPVRSILPIPQCVVNHIAPPVINLAYWGYLRLAVKILKLGLPKRSRVPLRPDQWL